ncbi:TVP38/TMEM64 family protein [Pseudofrancisella aestuarii]|uniref:TVP38/TMEM64 family protein n=1 Tax=Pseudofrancisella aestuarii TaxID=2670347 RepID=A0ABV9TD48_9GAMM|nr:TVP38/TMEM64 family protein [Pseudofrancisella aestuarii]
MRKKYKSIPIIILVIGLIVFFILGGYKYLTLETLKQNYENLLKFTSQNLILSSMIYSICYILVVAFSIPGAAVMTLLGGFLFGIVFGSILVVSSATIGAVILFLAVKTSFGEMLKDKAKGSVEKMRKGFSDNAFNYLLVLRLVPIFPFFVINIACGVLNIKLKDFFFGTLLGIIPGSVIYVWVGTGLGYAIKQGQELNLGIIFQKEFILPILALALLSLIPVIKKKLTRDKSYERS